MNKLHCVICSKNRKFEKPKLSYVLEKTLVLSRMKMKNYLQKKNQLKY